MGDISVRKKAFTIRQWVVGVLEDGFQIGESHGLSIL